MGINQLTKTLILQKVKEARTNKQDARNRMGCLENWYNPFWSIGQTFTDDELESMTDNELKNLYKLAENISDGLY